MIEIENLLGILNQNKSWIGLRRAWMTAMLTEPFKEAR